jgi:hypothetical protein
MGALLELSQVFKDIAPNLREIAGAIWTVRRRQGLDTTNDDVE